MYECECSDVAAQLLHLARDAVYVGSDGGDAAGDMVVYAGQLLGVAALHGERSVEALSQRRSGLVKDRAVCRPLLCVCQSAGGWWWWCLSRPRCSETRVSSTSCDTEAMKRGAGGVWGTEGDGDAESDGAGADATRVSVRQNCPSTLNTLTRWLKLSATAM